VMAAENAQGGRVEGFAAPFALDHVDFIVLPWQDEIDLANLLVPPLKRRRVGKVGLQKLRAMLCTLDPITMRASIESKLQTLYRERAWLPRLTALQPAFPRAESNAKTGLANPSKKRQTNPCHGVPHREAPSHLLKSSSASSFNEASRMPRSTNRFSRNLPTTSSGTDSEAGEPFRDSPAERPGSGLGLPRPMHNPSSRQV
jgi:hypothetical protein